MTNLLQDKIVVISGVGPGLGRSLALRCAAAGADVVLAARTAGPARRGGQGGHRPGPARAWRWPTDITDAATRRSTWSPPALEAYGRVDTLVNNAFAIPPMKPLARADFQSIRDAVELTVLARAAADAAVHPGARGVQGARW